MKRSKQIIALSACVLMGTSSATFAQEEEEDSYILEITRIEVKIGHDMQFRDAMKAYKSCLVEREYSESWSTWSNVGGEGREYHVVSNMDNWAEMDSPSDAGQACWSEHSEKLTSHVSSFETRFARPMKDWSGDAEGYNVVRLHHFRVDDNGDFRDTVGAITDIMKEADYEHLGSWYEMIGNDSNDPDYFVVSHYDNFAALDEDRAGAYDAIVEAAGQERADELWEQFGDSLRDDWEYFTDLLRREEELSYSSED